MRETTGKNEERLRKMFLSCPPGNERLATALCETLKKVWNSREISFYLETPIHARPNAFLCYIMKHNNIYLKGI